MRVISLCGVHLSDTDTEHRRCRISALLGRRPPKQRRKFLRQFDRAPLLDVRQIVRRIRSPVEIQAGTGRTELSRTVASDFKLLGEEHERGFVAKELDVYGQPVMAG